MTKLEKLLLIIFQFAWGQCYFPHDPFAPAEEMHDAIPFGYYPPLGEEDHVAALMAPIVDQENHDIYQTWNQYAGSFNFEDSSSAPFHSYEAQTNLAPHVDQQATALVPNFDHGQFSQGNNDLHQTWNNAGPSHYSPSALYDTSYQDFQSYYHNYDASYDPEAQTQDLQSNKQEIDSNDLLKVPLMPYYFAASSKLPYGPSQTVENGRTVEIVFKAIKKNFNINPHKSLEEFEPLIFDKNNSKKNAESLRLGFLGRLGVRNILFLIFIQHMNPDDAVEKEVDNTFHWLHEQLKNYPESDISRAVSEHWEKPFKTSRMLTIQGKNSKIRVSESEAIDTKIIILILDTYYRTSNTTKWNRIFQAKYSFLHFHVRQGIKSLNNEHSNALRTHWSRFQHSEFLPWRNKVIVKTARSVVFNDDWTKSNGAMHRRMAPFNSEEWQKWSSWFEEKLGD